MLPPGEYFHVRGEALERRYVDGTDNWLRERMRFVSRYRSFPDQPTDPITYGVNGPVAGISPGEGAEILRRQDAQDPRWRRR